MDKEDAEGRRPEPGQTVAAATTKTDEAQAHARNIRSTDWLAAGEGRARQDGPSCPEVPPNEHVVSAERAIEEALARLGPGAAAAEVQRELEWVGVRVSVDDVKRVQAQVCCRGAARVETAAPGPADLVRTEGEPVPPPRAATGDGDQPAAG